MMLYKTPWLKPDCIEWPYDFMLPNGQYFLCIGHFQAYFDVQVSDTIRLVAYDRPGKYRYRIDIEAEEFECAGLNYADLYIDGKEYLGAFYDPFEEFLIRIKKRFGNKPLYVECEIK